MCVRVCVHVCVCMGQMHPVHLSSRNLNPSLDVFITFIYLYGTFAGVCNI